MKLVKWVEQVQDRFKWKAIVENAKTHQSCSATEEEEGCYVTDYNHYTLHNVLLNTDMCALFMYIAGTPNVCLLTMNTA